MSISIVSTPLKLSIILLPLLLSGCVSSGGNLCINKFAEGTEGYAKCLANTGDKSKQYLYGVAQLEEGNNREAIKWLERAAKKIKERKYHWTMNGNIGYDTGKVDTGHVFAQQLLSEIYTKGLGVKKNLKKAARHNENLERHISKRNPEEFINREHIYNIDEVVNIPQGGHVIRGCLTTLDEEFVKIQFANNVSVNLTEFCQDDPIELETGDIFIIGYGRRSIEQKGDPLLCMGEGCQFIENNLYDEKLRYHPAFSVNRISLRSYIAQRIENSENWDVVMFQDPTYLKHSVAGAYLSDKVSGSRKMVCFVWDKHLENEKGRVLRECYGRWLERYRPVHWAEENGVHFRDVENSFNPLNPEHLRRMQEAVIEAQQ